MTPPRCESRVAHLRRWAVYVAGRYRFARLARRTRRGALAWAWVGAPWKWPVEACAHDYQHHPLAEDPGVCIHCGDEGEVPSDPAESRLAATIAANLPRALRHAPAVRERVAAVAESRRRGTDRGLSNRSKYR